jgi:hypothetical protein
MTLARCVCVCKCARKVHLFNVTKQASSRRKSELHYPSFCLIFRCRLPSLLSRTVPSLVRTLMRACILVSQFFCNFTSSTAKRTSEKIPFCRNSLGRATHNFTSQPILGIFAIETHGGIDNLCAITKASTRAGRACEGKRG